MVHKLWMGHMQGSANFKGRVFPERVDPARVSGFRAGFRVENLETRVARPVAEPWSHDIYDLNLFNFFSTI